VSLLTVEWLLETLVTSIAAEELRQIVLEELATLGFQWRDGELFLPEEQTKDLARKLHEPAKDMELARRQDWLRRSLPDYLPFFANGEDVDPEKIEPKLIEVRKPWHYELFRLARLTWSLPYSKGFGRRLTYLILDTYNDKLIGILRLQLANDNYNYPLMTIRNAH
jgi:virulence-associated protein VapD